jgi:ATP synthase I chain
MSQISNNVRAEDLPVPSDGALELRVFRYMIASIALAVIGSTFLAPWRVTAGLILGGALSLVNYHWLRTSVAAVFNVSGTERPRIKISGYIVRYFVVAGAAFAAYQMRLVTLTALLVGLCAFVPALFIEALRQFYFAIINREESF